MFKLGKAVYDWSMVLLSCYTNLNQTTLFVLQNRPYHKINFTNDFFYLCAPKYLNMAIENNKL